MKIGIDIDDTICETLKTVLPFACNYFEKDYKEIKKLNASAEYLMDYVFEDYFAFAKKYYKDITMNIPLKKDVVKYLNKLRKLGCEIVFITARGNEGYDEPYQASYDYLIKNKVPFDKLIVSASNKADVCLLEDVDIMIDDSVYNCTKLREKGITTFLFDAEYNKKERGFIRVKSWHQVYKMIKGGKYGRGKGSN